MKAIITLVSDVETSQKFFDGLDGHALIIPCALLSLEDVKWRDYEKFDYVVFKDFDQADIAMTNYAFDLMRELATFKPFSPGVINEGLNLKHVW
jgi:hypothetical protein